MQILNAQFDTIIALSLFFFSGFVTPGPNNFIIMVTSIKSGVKSTIPTCLGVIVGNTLLQTSIVIIYVGLNDNFSEIMYYLDYLKYLGIAYLFYLSFKLITSKEHKLENSKIPFHPSFFAMIMFQWVNPKAWSVDVGALSLVEPSQAYLLPIMVFTISIFTQFTWAFAGHYIRENIIGTLSERYINRIMGITLAISILLLII